MTLAPTCRGCDMAIKHVAQGLNASPLRMAHPRQRMHALMHQLGEACSMVGQMSGNKSALDYRWENKQPIIQ